MTHLTSHTRIQSAVGTGDWHLMKYGLLKGSSSLNGSTFVIVQDKIALYLFTNLIYWFYIYSLSFQFCSLEERMRVCF